MPFSRSRLLLFVLVCVSPFVCAAPGIFPRGAPGISSSSLHSDPRFAEKITIPGIRDAAKVNDFLFRGSQPSEPGLEQLKKLGITTIVDLRGELRGLADAEKEQAEALGMRVVMIRASGWSPPSDEQVIQFFQLVQKKPREKLYVHCWLGDDRTGVFIATYRIAFEHWHPDDAIREMYHFHFKGFWHPSMKAYIRDFPAHFAAAPAFASFRSHSATAWH
jgi:tyrosine-protein phosphatase SIW14